MSPNLNPLLELAILANLKKEEVNMVHSLFTFYGFQLKEWKNHNKLPESRKNSIILTDDISTRTIERSLEKKVGIIGRLSLEEKKRIQAAGIAWFWDIEKLPFTGFPVYSYQSKTILKVLIAGNDSIFNRLMRQILSSISYTTSISSSLQDTLILFEKDQFDLCIMDWDMNDMNLIHFLDSLKKLRYKPLLLGIKDFSKENLFQSLSAGIRNFSEILFSKAELLSIIIESLPLEPVLQFRQSTIKKTLTLFRNRNEITNFEITDAPEVNELPEIRSLKSGFDWLLNPIENHLD